LLLKKLLKEIEKKIDRSKHISRLLKNPKNETIPASYLG
jgi:hypothetical protein